MELKESDEIVVKIDKRMWDRNKKLLRSYYLSTPDENAKHFEDWPADVKVYFTKIFSYERVSTETEEGDVLKEEHWRLPPSTELYKSFYDFPILRKWDIELCEMKGRLNSYPKMAWSFHSRKIEPCRDILNELKVCKGYNVMTITWIKLQEILYTYPELCPKQGYFNSLHLCEAPGSCVESLNHYLHNRYSKGQINWDWLASTLNPYYEENNTMSAIHDDRFIYHTLDHWIFGKDLTGNIINLENIDYIKERCRERFHENGVHLITADGSIDCSSMERIQEKVVTQLNFSEILAALMILNEGGSFIIKMFTAFQSYTVSLIYLLNCVFEKVNVFKPFSSRRATSEVYYICINYKRNTENLPGIIEVMRERSHDKALILWPMFSKVPNEFYSQHLKCCRYFMNKQIHSIKHKIIMYPSGGTRSYSPKMIEEINGSLKIFKKAFLTKYPLTPLNEDSLLMSNFHSKWNKIQKLYQGIVTGIDHLESQDFSTYIYGLYQAIRKYSGVMKEKYCNLDHEMMKSSSDWWNLKLNAEDNDGSDPLHLLEISRGRPISTCCISLFVDKMTMDFMARFSQYGIDPYWCNEPKAISSEDNYEIPYEVTEKAAFAKDQANFFIRVLEHILSTAENEKNESSAKRILTFRNIPFLTHYSLSVLHYLTRFVYKELCISNSKDIFEIRLIDLRPSCWSSLQTLRQTLTEKSSNKPDLTIHRLFKIQELHDNHVYFPFEYFNSNLLLHNYQLILQNYYSSLSYTHNNE